MDDGHWYIFDLKSKNIIKEVMVMDEQRVQEIMDALHMINVNYHGIPVFIQDLHENNTATVFPLDEMDNHQIVDLNGLEEIDLINKNPEN